MICHLRQDGSGKAALLYLPIYPDVIRSTAGQVVEYLEPLIVLLTDHGQISGGERSQGSWNGVLLFYGGGGWNKVTKTDRHSDTCRSTDHT